MSLTTLQRLIKYPHAAVFDKDPGAELVFRLRHALGAAWLIADGVMTATAGAQEFSYDLATTTVAGLVAKLRADGFDVLSIASEFDTYSALVLISGSGQQAETNGDHVHAFTSLMWALMSGYAREVNAAEYQVRQALLQMVITTAEGEWLDLWGTLYGVPRLDGESDVAYRIRIPREAFRVRVNARAIELAIKELTGKDVQILESWTSVFTLDQSDLSGGDKIQDGERVGPFYIQAFSTTSIDWSDVLPIVLRNKPAGVLMLPPQVQHHTLLTVPADWALGTAITRRHVASVRLEDLALLDFASIEDTSVINHPILHRRSILHGGGAVMGSNTWQPYPWMNVPWDQVTYLAALDGWTSDRAYILTGPPGGEYWMGISWTGLSWADADVAIGTAHSSTSS